MRRSRGIVALVVALLASACSSSGTTHAAKPTAPADFYDVPSPLPGSTHGDLIRSERLPDLAGGHAYRVMYRSTSVSGKAIAVTGLVVVPATAGTDRVVVSWAHGTTGIADPCAPSKNPAAAVDPLLSQLLSRGWVVAATDYEGLGTPGRHPYLVGVSEGRGTLDIVRAARQLRGTGAGTRALLWGHSQGGHAALFAAQLAPTWTPELHVLGAVAGAPPSELPAIAAALKGGAFQGYIAMAAAGINAAYPDAKLADVLTPKGLALLDVVDRACTDGVFQAFGGVPYDDFVKADPSSVPAWKAALDRSDPGHEKLAMPLLIIHGEADEQIPPVASLLLFQRLCTLGQTVVRRTYPGLTHTSVVRPSFPDVVHWMDDRVAGAPAPTTCPTR